MEKQEQGIGKIIVSTMELPGEINVSSAAYLYSGKVLVTYTLPEDQGKKDYYRLAVADDDGTGFFEIFTGEIPQHPKANGIRFMPFLDNRRVLLGDYVLECTPDIDHCRRSALVPVNYPKNIENNPNTTAHWSEIIIAPDNEHISWTILRSDIGAAACIGVLARKEDCYDVEQPRIISTLENFKADPQREGYLIPQVIRGGEVKQFVRGGTAISVVGGKEGNTPNSVVQPLDSLELEQITFTPGYDETTIFSPDERLGIVMTSRASKKTDPAIFGRMPRPHGIQTSMGISRYLYTYAVTGVRMMRKGNVGPVLIDIRKSMEDRSYKGVPLYDPEEEWVYCSPMSWHPDGKRVMWPEILRGSAESEHGPVMRIQIARLPDYIPGTTVMPQKTPDNIPYAISDIHALDGEIKADVEGRIAGKSSGYIQYMHKTSGYNGQTLSEYHNYSDDGTTFYNGYEKLDFGIVTESCYSADIECTGPVSGVMKLNVCFAPIVGNNPAGILFDAGADGQPKSRGYVEIDGERMNVEDLSK